MGSTNEIILTYLDSDLSLKIPLNQKEEVIPIPFYSPVCLSPLTQ